jgi:hypothetical protein
MWRLAVYVGPEYLDRWWKIADVAGSVVFKQFDPNDDHPGAVGERFDTCLDSSRRSTDFPI